MNVFDHMASGAAPDPATAEVKVDLCGMEKPDALQKLDSVVKYCKKTGAASLYVSFDPARPGGGETLFQPVARYFKVEKFNDYVLSAVPLMGGGAAGLFVRFRL
jgi:hypothetical protein